MKRRDFVAAGAGAAAVAGTACVTPGGRAAPGAAVVDEDALLATMANADRSLDLLEHPSALDIIFRENPEITADASAQQTVRDVLRSLMMVGVFGDLSEEERLHPEVQRRMWLTLPALESSMASVTRGLARLTPKDLEKVAARLRADPGLPMRVCAAVAGPERKDAVSVRRRAQIRSIVTDITFRMQHQPPALLIGEVLGKYEKVGARAPSNAAAGRMVELAKDPVAWAAWAEQLRSGEARTDARAYFDNPPTVRDEWDRSPRDQRSMTAGEIVGTVGAVILGLGFLAAAGGFAFVRLTGQFVGVFAVTLGVLLLLIGLIVLAVGGVMMLADADRPRGRRWSSAQAEVNTAPTRATRKEIWDDRVRDELRSHTWEEPAAAPAPDGTEP